MTTTTAHAPLPARHPWQGVANIVRFNWPLYVAAGVMMAGALALAAILPAAWWPVRLLLVLGALGAGGSLLVSLAVSWWVYDRSPLYRWDWLRAMAVGEPARIVNIHSGFDESSGALQTLFPAAELVALDFYDPREQTEPSVARARRAYPHPPVPARPARADALPLADGSADLALLSLAAHEVRSAAGREALFREVARVLRPGGQAVLVEHGRDLANFLAFGPGFLHFFSPAEWRRVARTAGLTARGETRITPFVHVWDLRRPA